MTVRPHLVGYCQELWTEIPGSSGALLDSVYETDALKDGIEQLTPIQFPPGLLCALRQLEDHRQCGQARAAALGLVRA